VVGNYHLIFLKLTKLPQETLKTMKNKNNSENKGENSNRNNTSDQKVINNTCTIYSPWLV
jgi:hypothetical protein